MTDEITPFELAVPESVLDDLGNRLRSTRWPEAETAEGWLQGIPLAYLREVCDYWAEEYDWRLVESRLNQPRKAVQAYERALEADPADLATLRALGRLYTRLGASREAMAAGLGLRPDEIQEIEEGRASYEMVDHYAQWLDRIEAWPAEKRAQQLLAAIDGATRFVP